MGQWITRTVLSGSSVDANGTNSHTCTFTAATSGNFLVLVLAGSVTSSTPSGWTLRESAIGDTGVYLFTKTASSGESSFSTTHNASNRPIKGVVYEYAAGSSYQASNTEVGQPQTDTGPQVTGLTGTYSRFSARSWCMSASNSTGSGTWTTPSVEDFDAYVPNGGADGIFLTIAYDDNSTGASFTPSSALTIQDTGPTSGEGIAFALSVTTASSAIAAPWITA